MKMELKESRVLRKALTAHSLNWDHVHTDIGCTTHSNAISSEVNLDFQIDSPAGKTMIRVDIRTEDLVEIVSSLDENFLRLLLHKISEDKSTLSTIKVLSEAITSISKNIESVE